MSALCGGRGAKATSDDDLRREAVTKADLLLRHKCRSRETGEKDSTFLLQFKSYLAGDGFFISHTTS